LKNREKIVKTPPLPLNHPIKQSLGDKKQRLEQAKLAIGFPFYFEYIVFCIDAIYSLEFFLLLFSILIESHHTILTNKGYSRKPDGGFFTA
jgi:hypothetical protein